jgi:2,3-bisphosphoglycerate-independent phosphoglycerate mutase
MERWFMSNDLNDNYRPLLLLILDGWGIAYPGPGNAIALAKKPNFDQYCHAFPSGQLEAAGLAVGLPHGEDGNSETGHLNLGAGQIVYQDLARINASIADGSFFTLPGLKQAVDHVQKNHSTLHLMGLVGAGGVHANNEHLFALIRYAQKMKVGHLALQLFTDGRDSPPTSSQIYISQIKKVLQSSNHGVIASIIGRYYAMDRDFRWERTEKAYRCLTEGIGQKATSPEQAIQQSYRTGKTDEFIEPTNIVDANNTPLALIQDHDAVIFFNFRVDRPRQLSKAFVLKNFSADANKIGFDPYAEKYTKSHLGPTVIAQAPFKRKKFLNDLFFLTMTEYQKGLPAHVLVPELVIDYPLARVLSDHNLRQYHLAETEKERFITYYFDGIRSQPFPNEDWEVVASPRVATYDLQPEMSTPKITAKLIEKLQQRTYNFLVVNIACPDMVAHTGSIPATIKACEAVDQALGQILPTILALNGTAIITADHGNAEELINLQTGEVDTEHSANPVPVIIVSSQLESKAGPLPRGILADVAPTILKLLNIPKPQEMTGKSLIE